MQSLLSGRGQANGKIATLPLLPIPGATQVRCSGRRLGIGEDGPDGRTTRWRGLADDILNTSPDGQGASRERPMDPNDPGRAPDAPSPYGAPPSSPYLSLIHISEPTR